MNEHAEKIAEALGEAVGAGIVSQYAKPWAFC
jgi:hypothetical protein